MIALVSMTDTLWLHRVGDQCSGELMISILNDSHVEPKCNMCFILTLLHFKSSSFPRVCQSTMGAGTAEFLVDVTLDYVVACSSMVTVRTPRGSHSFSAAKVFQCALECQKMRWKARLAISFCALRLVVRATARYFRLVEIFFIR